MGRKIVLLSDGTGNSSAKVWRTNVWRVFERLDLSQSDQVAFYDDGVGTAAFKPVALLGGAFGYGLKRNVIDLYKFACRNYRNDDDEIYGFGFSRGAFTIRVVIGLIADQGLVKARSEPELHAKAVQAYRAFRAANFHTKWPPLLRPERWARALRNLFTRTKYDRCDNRPNVNIRFLGLWDTVAAYGMPVEEMTHGISNWVWPLMLPENSLSTSVRRACHALSLDDERTTFHPVLWDERNEAPLQPDANGCRYLHNERISQVWFAGVHANIGGGYPEDALAQIPLTWIMREAQKCGLRFKTDTAASPQTYEHPQTAQDKDGRIYDPRQGLGGYYRFGPRDIVPLGREMLARGGHEAIPRIHDSVFKRIATRAHAYAPIGLPAHYEVVRENGDQYEVVPVDEAVYEQPTCAVARCHEQQRAWNIVWWRRGLYFLTVGVSFYLFAFPVLRTAPVQDEFKSPLRWVSEILRLVERFLPEAASPWFDGYARRPGQFLLLAGLLGVLLLLSGRLAGQTQSKMDLAWQRSLRGDVEDIGPPTDLLYRVRTSRTYVTLHGWLKWHIAPAIFALLFVYLGVAFTSHLAFNVQDYAGLVCKETGTRHQLKPGDIVLANTTASPPFENDGQKRDPFTYLRSRNYTLLQFSTSQPCQNMGVKLQAGRRYLIKLETTDTFEDWSGTKAPYGYYSTAIIDESPRRLPFMRQVLNVALLPLRRELNYSWFQVMARVGGTGGEDSLLRPDFTEPKFKVNVPFTPRRDGELFLFMNGPVIGLPGLYGAFYRHHEGSTAVLIAQCGGGSTALC